MPPDASARRLPLRRSRSPGTSAADGAAAPRLRSEAKSRRAATAGGRRAARASGLPKGRGGCRWSRTLDGGRVRGEARRVQHMARDARVARRVRQDRRYQAQPQHCSRSRGQAPHGSLWCELSPPRTRQDFRLSCQTRHLASSAESVNTARDARNRQWQCWAPATTTCISAYDCGPSPAVV